MSIEKQKEIADKVLAGLELLDPFTILAGGAPRDWYFDTEASDLDFYMYKRIGQNQQAIKDRICKCLGYQGLTAECIDERVVKDHGAYERMKYLAKILDIKLEGVDTKIQVMLMSEPDSTFEVVDSFSTSICKVWYKSGVIKTTQQFKKTIATNMMWLNEDYHWSDPHPSKMVSKFPDFVVVSGEEDVDRELIAKALSLG